MNAMDDKLPIVEFVGGRTTPWWRTFHSQRGALRVAEAVLGVAAVCLSTIATMGLFYVAYAPREHRLPWWGLLAFGGVILIAMFAFGVRVWRDLPQLTGVETCGEASPSSRS